MPMYVDPEQLTKDRADFARRGISRGLTVVGAKCADGIVLVALNASASLKKISEIHDRIAFAGVGKYHEFESLRVGAIRWADSRAFQYSRADVSGLSLAIALAHAIGHAFTSGLKPLEVEILLAELGDEDGTLWRLGFDGSITDEPSPLVLGAHATDVRNDLLAAGLDDLPVQAAARKIAAVLTRHISPHTGVHIEAGALIRGTLPRTFSSIDISEVSP